MQHSHRSALPPLNQKHAGALVHTSFTIGICPADAQPSTTPTTYPYPFGLTPYRYPCLTPHLPQPPPGDPANPHFRAFDAAEAEAFHQSLVQNNQAYSTLASYLDDGKEKA